MNNIKKKRSASEIQRLIEELIPLPKPRIVTSKVSDCSLLKYLDNYFI